MQQPPQIFDYRRLRARINPLHSRVAALQKLLMQTLQNRMGLFSRQFHVQVEQHFTHCLLQGARLNIHSEFIPFKRNSLDLVLSIGPLMFTNDIPGVLKQWYATLKPGGVFMGAFFGEDTLKELRDCFFTVEEQLGIPHTLRLLPTIATKDAGMLMQRAGFHLPNSDRTRHLHQITDIKELLHILKAMGGNILHDRASTSLGKEFLKLVAAEYTKRYAVGDKLNVTIDVICMTGWAVERYADERIQQQTPKQIGYL